MNALALLVCWLPGAGESPLQVREAVVDRGDVKAGAPLIQTFSIRNTADARVVVVGVSGGCGCARSTISRTQLEPGESADLRVELNTLAQPAGPNTWPATVRYRLGEQSEQTLEVRIKATLVREIEVKPIALALTIDREARQRIEIVDRRDRPLRIKECRISNRSIEVETIAPETTGGSVGLLIRASLPPGKHQETLTILTDDPDYRELRVPITIFKRTPGQLVATPERVDFRLAKEQQSASALIRLRDPDDGPIVIERIETDHPALRGKWAAGPGHLVTLRVGIELDERRAAGQGAITIHVKEPKPQMLVVPVTWKE